MISLSAKIVCTVYQKKTWEIFRLFQFGPKRRKWCSNFLVSETRFRKQANFDNCIQFPWAQTRFIHQIWASIDRMSCLGAMISVIDSVIVSASIAGIQMKRGKEGFLTGRIKARESVKRTLDSKGGRFQSLLLACWRSDCNSLLTNSQTYSLVICITQLSHWGKRGVVTQPVKIQRFSSLLAVSQERRLSLNDENYSDFSDGT